MDFNVNHPVLFLLAGIIVLIVLAQSVYFLCKAWRRGREIGMPMDKLNGANFKKVIIQQFKLPITNITHLVKQADFDAESCERIGVPYPYRGIYMQAVARSGRGQCVYYQEFFLGPTSRDLAFPDSNLSSG